MNEFLQQKQAAALLGITPRRLRQIDNEDDPPSKLDGKYPAEQFGKWLEARILKRLSVMEDGEVLDYTQERARLTKAQADHEELKVSEKDGTLIPAWAVKEAWLQHVVAVRAILLALPTKIAPVVMSANSIRDVEGFARDEVFRALDDLEAATTPGQ